jgi:Na+-driven multidrug efflux pump
MAGGATVGAVCALIGVIVAAAPSLWMGLFTDDDGIVLVGASYLQIVGPIYGFYGLAMALYFAAQGFGSVVWTVTANAVRLLVNTGCALLAIYWLDLGAPAFFISIAAGFCAYAALTSAAIFRVQRF